MEKEQNITELLNYIKEVDGKQENLIMILHKAQELFGYLPKDILVIIAKKLKMPLAKVYGVVTFYSFFKTEKEGKYAIDICLGTACFVRGAEEILNEFKKELKIDIGETTEDGLFTLQSLRCIGACSLAPVISINGKIYGKLKSEDIKPIIAEYRSKGNKNE